MELKRGEKKSRGWVGCSEGRTQDPWSRRGLYFLNIRAISFRRGLCNYVISSEGHYAPSNPPPMNTPLVG